MKIACLLVGDNYEIGSQPPEGYLQWHEWARMQHKAGLKQQVCGRCGKYKFPQELMDKQDSFLATKNNGEKIEVKSCICLKCDK